MPGFGGRMSQRKGVNGGWVPGESWEVGIEIGIGTGGMSQWRSDTGRVMGGRDRDRDRDRGE